MTAVDQYFLGYRPAEQERLREQAMLLADDAAWLFDQVGLRAGQSVVELGCGPRGCLDLLAERVGPRGDVLGIERSPDAVALARKLMRELELTNVEVRRGDARATGLARGGFDVATARLVLVNVPAPEEIVAEAVALVRPGGAVAFHDADYVSHVCDPSLPALDRLLELFHASAQLTGIDLTVGRTLPRLLRQAGLVDVQARPMVSIFPPGHPRRTITLDLVDNVASRWLAQGLTTESELAVLIASLRRHLEDPDTLVMSHLFVQAWGRKPL
jgi:SAM-dependent methyltransferase